MTWKNSTLNATIQWFLILVSFTDFTIYTANFMYGIYLTFSKPGTPWSQRVSTLMVGLGFLLARFFYLPFLFLLVPTDNLIILPEWVYDLTLVVLFFFYFLLLIMPLLFAIRWIWHFKLWRDPILDNHRQAHAKVQELAEAAQYRCENMNNMVVMMPIYNEDPDALCLAVESVVKSIYPLNKITVYLSFDDDSESELLHHLFAYIGKPLTPGTWTGRTIVMYKQVKFVINGFPHGGKRGTQALTFQQISKDFGAETLESTYLLYIDSDIILHPDAMIEFIKASEKNPTLVGMTGFISAISSRKANFLWYFQDCEYVVGQIISRSLEAGMGGVTCLPGALTMIRMKEMSRCAKTYFSSLPTEDVFDFHRYHLGEDRFMTHLLMQENEAYSLGFCPSARAKTVAPDSWTSFVKQRRRWLLGAFSNEIYFLSDVHLWYKVPGLLLYKLLDFASRSASFFIYLVTFQILTGVHFSPIQSFVIWLPLIATWVLVGAVAFLIRRLKVFYMYPLIILLNPWFYFFINTYSILTWNVRSWGGPRVTSDADEVFDLKVDSRSEGRASSEDRVSSEGSTVYASTPPFPPVSSDAVSVSSQELMMVRGSSSAPTVIRVDADDISKQPGAHLPTPSLAFLFSYHEKDEIDADKQKL